MSGHYGYKVGLCLVLFTHPLSSLSTATCTRTSAIHAKLTKIRIVHSIVLSLHQLQIATSTKLTPKEPAMGIIRTAILTGGGIYAVNKIAK